jgi:hypothetical protein
MQNSCQAVCNATSLCSEVRPSRNLFTFSLQMDWLCIYRSAGMLSLWLPRCINLSECYSYPIRKYYEFLSSKWVDEYSVCSMFCTSLTHFMSTFLPPCCIQFSLQCAHYLHCSHFSTVMCIPIARQWLNKYIHTQANVHDNRMSVVRQQRGTHALSTVQAVFSVWPVQRGYKRTHSEE